MQKFLYLPREKSFVGIDYITKVSVRCGQFAEENSVCHCIYIELHGDKDEYIYERFEKEELAYIVMEEVFKGIRTR